MGFLTEGDSRDVRTYLNSMSEPVELLIFTTETNCQYCKDTKMLLAELSVLSDKISLKAFDMELDHALAEQYRIDKAPGIVVKGKYDYGIRYFGIPSGYEFNSLIEDILDISSQNHGFSEEQLEKIARINSPVHLQVFVTPACPYCPVAVRSAHRLAMVNEFITADMVEATEFPELTEKYHVRGVPRTMVNEDFNIDGGLPEDAFIHQILEHLDNHPRASA